MITITIECKDAQEAKQMTDRLASTTDIQGERDAMRAAVESAAGHAAFELLSIFWPEERKAMYRPDVETLKADGVMFREIIVQHMKRSGAIP